MVLLHVNAALKNKYANKYDAVLFFTVRNTTMMNTYLE